MFCNLGFFCAKVTEAPRETGRRREEVNNTKIAAELVERIKMDARAVRVAALAWAGRMRDAGEAAEAEDALELADTVEGSLLADGAYALVDLLLVGRSLGGLSDADVRAMFELADERVARRLTLAA